MADHRAVTFRWMGWGGGGWWVTSSVGDLDLDPHFFGPPRSGSISQRVRSWIRIRLLILLFYIKVLSRLK
jgi:hypothetical protein